MFRSKFTFGAAGIGLALLSQSVLGSPASDEEPAVEPQRSGAIELPIWTPGECRDNFDIRIWPDETVVWLEQENMRDLIADPETPEEERKALRKILALQRAWST
jgi:hypothetical protein